MSQYCVKVTSTDVTPITGVLNGPPGPWPGALIASPRLFQYNNITYNLQDEGLYKFSVPAQNTTNMIIYNGDVIKLLESLTYLVVPGQDDVAKSIAAINSRSLSSRVHLLCEPTAQWVRSLLNSLGISNRIVRMLRKDTPNGFYDGHVVNEVKVNGVWTLFDLCIGLKFTDGLNLLGLKDTAPILTNSTMQKMHSFKDYLASEQCYNNVYHHSSTADMFLASETMMLDWQRDIMQIPGIDYTDGLTYFYIPDSCVGRESWLLSLSTSYRIVNKTTWLSMFY